MAKIPHFEQPTGVVDGTNTVFTTNTPYIPGSVVVFLRGIPRVQAWDDGWFETDPATGTVTLKEPPCEGDDVQIMWCEEGPDVAAEEVTPLQGIIESADISLSGLLCNDISMLACITSADSQLCGTIEGQNLTGQVSTLESMCGIICECES